MGISLPALADLPGFVPAPVTSVVSVSFSTAGVPIYKVNPESGVPLSCLPAYFEAYDAYAQRVDHEVSWVEGEEKRVEPLQTQRRPQPQQGTRLLLLPKTTLS